MVPPPRPGNEKTCAPSAIALLLPGVALVVIATLLPEAGLVARDELDALQPLRALPEIELGHDRAHRAAMLAGQGLALPLVSEQRVIVVEVLELEVGRVAVVAVEDQMTRPLERRHHRQDVLGRNALPA